MPENKIRQVKKLTELLEHAKMLAYLQNPNIMEIMLNPDGNLWIEEFGNAMRSVEQVDPNDAQ